MNVGTERFLEVYGRQKLMVQTECKAGYRNKLLEVRRRHTVQHTVCHHHQRQLEIDSFRHTQPLQYREGVSDVVVATIRRSVFITTCRTKTRVYPHGTRPIAQFQNETDFAVHTLEWFGFCCHPPAVLLYQLCCLVLLFPVLQLLHLSTI